MRILIKFPTRSRPELFLKTISDYIDKAKHKGLITFLVSLDLNDESMKNFHLRIPTSCLERIIFVYGESKNKIEACNRDIDKLMNTWDIILLASDDMHVQLEGWDERIRNDMFLNFPDTDGCLWYHDGSHQKQISTLSCMGRKYYERFGYIYHPSYKSFWCDNEYTEVAQRLGKIIFIDEVIIKHDHPAWDSSIKADDLYRHNDSFWNHDVENYNNRKSLNFPN